MDIFEEGIIKEKNQKLYLLKKVNFKIENKQKYSNKIEFLFENPKTFLNLPKESNFQFIINKTLTGPKFDKDDKPIPHSFVGNFKNLSNKNIFNKSIYNKARISNSSKSRDVFNYNYNNFFSKDCNEITDKNIKKIFKKFKDKISNNVQRNKTVDDYKSHNINNIMENLIKKKLKIQEKCLKNSKSYTNKIEKMKDNIQNQVKLKLKRKQFNDLKASHLSANLIMDSVNNYFFKKKAKSIIQANKNYEEEKKNKNFEINSYTEKQKNKDTITNPDIKWQMSLRRPKNFNGIRKKILNINTSDNPFCFIFTEKKHDNKEYILDSRFNTENNFYKNNNEKLNKRDIKHLNNIKTLNINGEKLIDFEENLCLKLKGKKKKLHKFIYEDKYTRDLNIFTNYYFRGHSFSRNKK